MRCLTSSLIAAVVLCAAAAFAEPENRLRGIVYDRQAGTGLEGVEVACKISEPQGRLLGITRTSATGGYELRADASVRVLDIVFQKLGYQPEARERIANDTDPHNMEPIALSKESEVLRDLAETRNALHAYLAYIRITGDVSGAARSFGVLRRRNPALIARLLLGEETLNRAAGASGLLAEVSPRRRWLVQSSWPAGSVGYSEFLRLAWRIRELSAGQVSVEPLPSGAVVPPPEMLEAVKARKLDGMHTFIAFSSPKIPAAAFLTSYPLGMDRPEQWETWYYQWGGLGFARKAYEREGLFFVGPIQSGPSIIYSKVPFRSLNDLKGKRIRVPPGLTANVYQAFGAIPVPPPRGEIYVALERGVIDAAEGVGMMPSPDLAKVAKFVPAPALFRPVELLEFTVNQKAWQEIPPASQQAITTALREHSRSHYEAIQKALVESYRMFAEVGGQLEVLPKDEAERLRRVSLPAWVKTAEQDQIAKDVLASQLKYMEILGYVKDDWLRSLKKD